MSETTKIEWCDATVNFWWGCTKVSPGCANCYADTLSKRYGKEVWGKGQPREDHRKGATKLAMKLNRQAAAEGRRLRVFSASMSDWLDDEVPIEWLADLLNLIRLTPNLDWLLLTKRPENWMNRIALAGCYANENWSGHDRYQTTDVAESWMQGQPPANVWIGTTVEDQKRADERIPHFLAIPAKVRFLSCEPLLEPLDLGLARIEEECGFRHSENCGGFCEFACGGEDIKGGIDWVICGGESGQKCRHFSADWARSLRDQCQSAGVAFFMKQMGGIKKPFEPIPDDLMIREFPKGGAQ